MAAKSTPAKAAAKKATPAKAATATSGPKADRVIKAGGDKGKAVVELLTKEPGLTRTQLAEKIGCTTGRVGEVVRFLANHGTTEEKALIAKHVAAQPPRKTAVKATPTAPARGNSAKAAPAKKAATPRKTGAAKKAATTAAQTSTPSAE